MGDSHGALIDLRLTVKHATANILDFSLDKTPFRSAHSKAYEVVIGKPNFEVVATSSYDILCRCSLVDGEGPKAGCDGALNKLRLR
jgi:hypothetical protein